MKYMISRKIVKQPKNKGVAKVPVVMQLEMLECGAASLSMILAYYNKWIPLEKVRADCGVSRDGASAKNIVKAARRYNLKAQGYRYDSDTLRKIGKFPCIIHWNFNHFVVLAGFRGNRAYINDPARGSYSIPMSDFKDSYTGICLIFEPDENFTPSGKQKSMWAFTKERLKGTRRAIIFVLITSFITSILGIISPAFSRVFLDRLLTGENSDWLMPFTLAFTLFILVQVTMETIHAIYALKINGKMDAVSTTSFMWKVLRMPMEFFSQRMAGDIEQRQASNATIAAELVNTVAPLAINTVLLIFYFAVMLQFSLTLTLIGLISIVINFILSRIISKKRINITRVQMRDAGKLAAATVAGINMIETIKSSGSENGYFEKWSDYQASVNTQEVKYAKINQYLGMLPTLVTELTNTIVLMLGVYLIIEGYFTPGVLMAFQGYFASFISPCKEFIEASQSIQELRTTMERVEDVMQYPTEIDYTEEIPKVDSDLDKLSGSIELKNITFGYSKLSEPVIRDFNLSIKPGQRIAVVGGSGSGKSTVAKLISGLYHQWSGELLFDGKPIEAYRPEIFRSSIAVVDQDIILFEDTIANNIKMWDSSIEDFEMILAARDAQIHQDIMSREKGYQHRLVEGGRDLSGGQRQRIEIARVLAQDPTIVVLDEATSALDAKTEYDVIKSIEDRGIACIVIAHRLSTIRDCDEIIVLDKGIIVERGTHEELLNKNGLYRELIANE